MFNNSQTYSDIWQLCLNRIKEQTSAEEFAKWFQPIVPLEFDGTTLRLRVPNASYVYQIEKNYIPFLRPIISQLYGQQTRLHYAVPKAEAPKLDTETDSTAISRFATQNDTANIKNPFIIPGLKRVRIDPQLNPNYTFSTFIEGECNRLARSAGMSVAVNPGTTPFNPLYIYGDSGLGKTHIAQSIGHEVLQRHPELQVLYVSMNKFQAQFQTAHKRGEIPDFIHFYQMIDVLIIDDMISSGGSMLDVAKQLKERNAKRVFVCTTYGLFTDGLDKFDEYYEKGWLDRVITTNLNYRIPELLERPYYVEANMSKYLASIIDIINHDVSVEKVRSSNEKIMSLMEKVNSR